MYSYWPPHTAVQKQDDQHEHTFSSYVRIRDVVLKTYLGRWTIGRSGERGSGISELPARYDDDDSLSNQKVLFHPYLGSYQVLQLRTRVDLRVMVIKGYSTFLKAPGEEPHHLMVLCHRQDTLWGVFSLCKDAIDAFYSTSWLSFQRWGCKIFLKVQKHA